MIEFSFTDSSGEKYGISIGWQEVNKCTICVYPQKFHKQSLAMCSFSFTDKLLVEENKEWAKEFLSSEAEEHINILIKNKLYW